VDIIKLLEKKMEKNITITIKAKIATDFQEILLNKMIRVLLDALKINMEDSNKGNKIIYEIDTHDGYKIRKV